jgi:hypothetical protein
MSSLRLIFKIKKCRNQLSSAGRNNKQFLLRLNNIPDLHKLHGNDYFFKGEGGREWQ